MAKQSVLIHPKAVASRSVSQLAPPIDFNLLLLC